MSQSRIQSRDQSSRSTQGEGSSFDANSNALRQEGAEDAHISLSDLFSHTRSVRHLPTRIQGNEKKLLLLSAAGNALGLIALEFAVPPIQSAILGSIGSGFFSVMGGPAKYWLSCVDVLTPVMFWTMVIGLVLATSVFVLSLGTTRAVREPVHWVAWAASWIPSISVIAALLLALSFAGIFALELAIGILIVVVKVVITISVLGFILAALLAPLSN